MDSKTDAELVHLAPAGNRAAFDELVLRYRRPIRGLACLLVDDSFEAEDLTQEAFLRAWQNLDLLSDPAKFGPWLRRIVLAFPSIGCARFDPTFITQRMSNPNYGQSLWSDRSHNH
ncbi:MAG TPA: RNA polymerase sigma factor [Terriglobales bacterium]|nr:RNA polymerase sigma factor [Terriglobales bacterium]